MTAIEFKEWPKISRYNRDIVISEKIDGTNGAIGVVALDQGAPVPPEVLSVVTMFDPETRALGLFGVYAQSRSRILSTAKGEDNHGFAGWVAERGDVVARALGPGLHFGEFAGAGIGKRYSGPMLALRPRKFWLFNTSRWSNQLPQAALDAGLRCVPVLYEGPNGQAPINQAIQKLRASGSYAYPLAQSEGIVIFHKQGNTMQKITLEGDAQPKGAQ